MRIDAYFFFVLICYTGLETFSDTHTHTHCLTHTQASSHGSRQTHTHQDADTYGPNVLVLKLSTPFHTQT